MPFFHSRGRRYGLSTPTPLDPSAKEPEEGLVLATKTSTDVRRWFCMIAVLIVISLLVVISIRAADQAMGFEYTWKQ